MKIQRRSALKSMVAATLGTGLPGNLLASYPDILYTRGILLEAHRGNSMHAPENTMVAFEEALEIGIDRLEVDLEFSADEKLVVIHDTTVDRTTNGTGNVSGITWDKLSRLDAGKWKDEKYTGEKIPLLSEVLDLCKGKAMVNIDLKNNKAVPAMVKAIKDQNMQDDVTITGRVPASVEDIRNEGINLTMFYEVTPAVSALINEHKPIAAIHKAIGEAREYMLPGFLFHTGWVTPEVVYHAHLHGLVVSVYDVNTPEETRRVMQAHVDAIMTDDPAMVKAALNS